MGSSSSKKSDEIFIGFKIKTMKSQNLTENNRISNDYFQTPFVETADFLDANFHRDKISMESRNQKMDILCDIPHSIVHCIETSFIIVKFHRELALKV